MFNFKKLVNKIFKGEEPVKKSNIKFEEVVLGQPFKNLYFAGTCITVVMNDNTVLMTGNGDINLYDSLRNAKTEYEVKKLMSIKNDAPKVEKEDKDEVIDKEIVETLIESPYGGLSPDLEVKGNNIQMKGVDMPIPGIIVSALNDAYGKPEYLPLKKFWLRLSLNPIAACREDIYNFIRKNNVKITDNGLMVLYRRIVSVNKESKDKELIEYISTQYAKVKIMKKSPKKYSIYKFEGKFINLPDGKEKGEKIGQLKELYDGLKDNEENHYTAAHDNKMVIKIGDVYKIDDSKINLDNGICAAGGLHAASRNYNYSGFGDVPVMVLVNPSKAITVPRYDNGKLRTTEMFIAAVLEIKNGMYMDDKVNVVGFDEEYAAITMEELEEAVKNHDFTPATIKDKVVVKEISQLELIKNQLKQRVETV